MEKVAVSRRNHTNKGNKENAQPTHGSKPIIRRDKTSSAPFHLKSNDKEALKKHFEEAKIKQADTRSASGMALKKLKTVETNEKGGAASDAARQQTHSQVFHAGQAVKHKKLATEAPKPPTIMQPPKSAPGMYKGKIVQSKIGSIWKSSASVDSSAPSRETHMAGKVAKSKPVAERSLCSTKKPAQTVSKSLLNRPAQVSKRVVTSRPLTGSYSAHPPARTIPATLTSTSSRNPPVAVTKKSGTLHSKPKIPVTHKKVSKPPVSSSLSQYRLTMETAEEKRAKLAEWLASKGKTFKRPAMTTAQPPVTTLPKPAAHLQSQSQCKPVPEPSLELCEPESAAADCADTQRAAIMPRNATPAIINTTLELLDNSDVDLSDDTQDRVDDIVVNLCDALEAMATPSRCSDEGSQVSDESNGVETDDCQPKEECLKEEVKNKAEESDKHEVQTDEDGAEEEESDDDVTEPMTEMGDASVVKYSVKTTPYLQSVKKKIENEATSSTSRRKSNIKDLKFLTPVRRSTRIHRKSSHLPMMLVDHDPCVSSLAELVKLDDDANAYIYRKNPALLEDLPDQPSL